jgi:molybdenum cofactor synthesis domain-containing protein
MKAAILTISDRSARGEREDLSGPALAEVLQAEEWDIIRMGVVSDDQSEIERALVEWAEGGEVVVIITTGGTGFGPRDRAPEATMNVVDRLAPGMAEAMRAGSLKVTPHAMLSRAVCGIRGRTLIVNLPGSPTAAVENLKFILPALPHAAQLLGGEPSSDVGHQWRQSQDED